LATFVDEKVEGKLAERLKALGLDDGTDDVTTKTTNTTTTPPPAGGTGAAESARVEELVRAEIAKVTTEKERDDRIGALEKKVEVAPRKVSRLARVMWGAQ